MSWKNVTNNAIDIKKDAPNTEHIGTYTGSREIETKVGKNTIWEFNDEDGNPYAMFGFTWLNQSMKNIKVGTLTKIVYTGMHKKKGKFGIKDTHTCTVQIDDSQESVKKAEKEDGIPF